MVWVWMTATSAFAQVTDGAVPEINAQTFRPNVDGRRLLWLDDAAKGESGFVGRGLLQYVDDPLVYLGRDDEEIEIVSSVLQLDLLAALRAGPVRFGVDVPIYLLSDGEPNGTETGLGDLGLDGKVVLLDKAVSLGVGGRLYLPTATVETALGSPNVGYEVSAIASADVGPVLLAANLGTRGGPPAELENIALDDAFLVRLGAALRLSPVVDTALEFNGQIPYSAPLSNIDGSPLEALGSLSLRPRRSDWVVRAGAGTGITTGIGSPDYRFVLGVGFEPRGEIRADDVCPEVAECPPVADRCPDEEEDVDGFEDDDGCYDPTIVEVLVVEEGSGDPIEVARIVVESDKERISGTTPFTEPVDAEQVTIQARARGYSSASVRYAVQGGPPKQVVIPLRKLDPPEPEVTAERIDLKDTIEFETASSVIKAESFELLDEAVAILEDYPEIEILRIEGHTDRHGGDESNLRLSRRRADAVRQYFIHAGIAESRLESVGYGEARPVDPRPTPEADAKNRRVDFFVQRWADRPARRESIGE